MVSKIEAYKAEDGSIHESMVKATEHDALVSLKALQIFNEGSAIAVLQQADQIFSILQPVVTARAFAKGDPA